MKRVVGNARKTVASDLSNALKAERSKIDEVQKSKFSAEQVRRKESMSTQEFPRTLDDRTFFTPHLPSTKRVNYAGNIVREYAVILKLGDSWVIARPTFNPITTPIHPTKQLDTQKLPADLQNKIHALEKSGYSFLAATNDIVVFEILYNKRQKSRRDASKGAIAMITGVVILTGTLFAAEGLVNNFSFG